MQRMNLDTLLLLAQDATEEVAKELPLIQQPWFMFVVVLATIAICFLLGIFLAKQIRMDDYGWKLGLMLSSLLVALEVGAFQQPMFRPKFGVDLSGGVTFIAQLAKTDDGDDPVPIATLIPRLKERLDPTGTKDIILRGLGDDKIEIIIPEADDQEAERIWKRAVKAGYLQFRIVADERYHAQLMEVAKLPSNKGKRILYDETVREGEKVRELGRWIRLDRSTLKNGELGPFRYSPYSTNMICDRKTREILSLQDWQNSRKPLEAWLEDTGHDAIDILMVAPPSEKQDVDGEDLRTVYAGMDDKGGAAVDFTMDLEGTKKFLALTSANIPRNENYRQLGIVLDSSLMSAPRIESAIAGRGQISGNFSKEEVEDLVGILKAGRLPAALNQNWISKDNVDSNIGAEMRVQGIWAILSSFVVVLIFMLIYYRFAGIIACLALLTNLVLILGIIMLIKAPITLTGMAGLVLTVGMSVDANVLIFERIREELNRGSSLRMAIRNGFGKATTTIVDANVTTLITAVVLYAIGTEQIKGFSVTLIFGILMSMYTAIFCSRVTFDIAERQRWITKLTMMQIVGTSKYDFIGKRGMATAFSLMIIVIGSIAVVTRGGSIFGHDLRGGTTARIVFNDKMDVEAVRSSLEKRFQGAEPFADKGKVLVDGEQQTVEVSELTSSDLPNGTVFKIDTSIQPIESEDEEIIADYPRLETILNETFSDKLAHYTLDIKGYQVARLEDQGDNAPSSDGKPANGSDDSKDDDVSLNRNPTGTDVPAAFRQAYMFTSLQNESSEEGSSQEASSTPETADSPSGTTPSTTDAASTTDQPAETGDTTTQPADPPVEPSGGSAEAGSDTPGSSFSGTPNEGADGSTIGQLPTVDRYQGQATLEFTYKIGHDALADSILEQAERLGLSLDESQFVVDSEDFDPEEPEALSAWNVSLVVFEDEDGPAKILEAVQNDFNQRPYFRSLSGVGGQIAGESQVDAFVALFACLIGIVIYIWIRFQKVAYGLAAVVALIHDILVVLGAIAISSYISGIPLIDNFKISLPVVAAFLTIIGYSLNDTIVVFDRIREVRGKNPKLTPEMINTSIGQTLSRTLLTSFTTFIVVFILFVMGGDAIHGFAFALVIGVIVGTYSSIFVASPTLLWLSSGRGDKKPLPADK